MMPPVVSALLAFVVALFRSHRSMPRDILAPRHQLAVYQRSVPRPRIWPMDRLLWSWLARCWSGWQDALAFVQPRAVLASQQRRFHGHWRCLSQNGKPGRPALATEVRELIRNISRANPAWGFPRIVGELRKLGIEVAPSTVEKYRMRPRKPPSPTWKTCLTNHMRDVVSLDFLTVPTVTYPGLFVLVILAHERRRVVHGNVTEHATAEWTAQQVVEAVSWDEAPQYLLRDRDRIDGASFRQRVRNMGIAEVVINPCSSWQSPYVERLIGSIRRECLDPEVVLSERHLTCVLQSYITYDHRWRTHLALDMAGPERRPVQPPAHGQVMACLEVGGLHHHDERRAA
jgi:putative transposase